MTNPEPREGEMVSVPIEPTVEMVDAGFEIFESTFCCFTLSNDYVRRIYRAMLSASPKGD